MKLKNKLLGLILLFVIAGCSPEIVIKPYDGKDAIVSNISDVSNAYYISVKAWTMKRSEKELEKVIQQLGEDKGYTYIYELSHGYYGNTVMKRVKFFRSLERVEAFSKDYNPFA